MHTYNITHLKLYIPQVQHSGFEQSEPDNEIDLQNVLIVLSSMSMSKI